MSEQSNVINIDGKEYNQEDLEARITALEGA